MGEKALYRKVDFQGDRLGESGAGYASSKANLPDAQLWSDFQAGSETAFAQLYQQYAQALYGYGFNIAPRKALVLDTIHDLFVDLWEAKENLGKVKSIKGYLFASFRRRLLKQLAKQRKQFNADVQPEEAAPLTVSADHQLVEKQTFDAENQKLEKALAKLSPKQKEILHLKFHAQLNFKEIGQIMDLDRKAAYNLMARVIAKLRRLMAVALIMAALLSFVFL